MKPKYQLSICIVFFILCTSFPTFADDEKTYHLITMEFAPYNYTENGQITGICTDIVKEILNRVGHPDKIYSFPLVRAYKMLEKEDDIILFSRLRTPEREKENKWVGPLFPFRLVLYAKKEAGIRIPNIESAKQYRVGCSRDSGGHRLLLRHGFSHIDTLANGTRNALKLESKRIDLWMTSELVGKYGAKINDVDPNQFEVVYEFQPVHSLYIAFSNNIPDNVVAKWQSVFDELKTQGIYDKIVDKYLKALNKKNGN